MLLLWFRVPRGAGTQRWHRPRKESCVCCISSITVHQVLFSIKLKRLIADDLRHANKVSRPALLSSKRYSTCYNASTWPRGAALVTCAQMSSRPPECSQRTL
jgi:hypothetical protein